MNTSLLCKYVRQSLKNCFLVFKLLRRYQAEDESDENQIFCARKFRFILEIWVLKLFFTHDSLRNFLGRGSPRKGRVLEANY